MSKKKSEITRINQVLEELESEIGSKENVTCEFDKKAVNACLNTLLMENETRERTDKVLDQLLKESECKENMTDAVSAVMYEQKEKRDLYRKFRKQYREEYRQEKEATISEAIDDVIFELQEKEDEEKWNRYKSTTTRRLKSIVAMMATIALMLSIGFAWYSRYQKHVDTIESQIMTPYTLYLLNSGATDALELNVGGIHPGEKKQIVVCVSSHDAMQEQLSKDGTFPYSLELVYTKNIGLNYYLYPLTKTVAADEDAFTSYYTVVDENGQTEQRAAYFNVGEKLVKSSDNTSEYVAEMYQQHSDKLAEIVNQGQYDVYTGDDFKLSLNDENLRYNYYLVEICWDGAISDTISKETDLIYLVAKAGVPKPVEIVQAD